MNKRPLYHTVNEFSFVSNLNHLPCIRCTRTHLNIIFCRHKSWQPTRICQQRLWCGESPLHSSNCSRGCWKRSCGRECGVRTRQNSKCVPSTAPSIMHMIKCLCNLSLTLFDYLRFAVFVPAVVSAEQTSMASAAKPNRAIFGHFTLLTAPPLLAVLCSQLRSVNRQAQLDSIGLFE